MTRSGGARPGLRRELLLLLVVGGFGVAVLPFLVYALGQATLGPYEGGGLGDFLGELYGDVLRLSPAAWALLLGPYLLFQAVRFLTRPLRRRRVPGSGPADEDDDRPAARPATAREPLGPSAEGAAAATAARRRRAVDDFKL